MMHCKVFNVFIFLMTPAIISGLPSVNLGYSSFLDGGPLRPRAGFYFQQYALCYHAHLFKDANGNTIIPSPDFNALAGATQFIYQFNFLPNVDYGIDASVPYVVFSRVQKNQLGIIDSGAGLGDLVLGNYLQFHPIFYHGRAIFVHRLEFSAGFPTGKDKYPYALINPGSKFFYIDPYWAFTVYLTPTLASSWRIHYLWSGQNDRTLIQAGDAVHFNYTLEWEVIPDLWIGMNGYFLQQLRNDRIGGIEIPDTRERVFAIGAGALYIPNREAFDLFIFANLYFESHARNRPQGISLVVHVLKYFGEF